MSEDTSESMSKSLWECADENAVEARRFGGGDGGGDGEEQGESGDEGDDICGNGWSRLCGNVVAYDSNLVVEKLLEVETKLHASRSMMHDTLPNPRLRLHSPLPQRVV